MSSTDRRTDGRTDKVNPVYNFVGRDIKTETSLSGHFPLSDMEVYVDLNHVSKLLPAVLDRVAEINRLEDFQGLLNSITQTPYGVLPLFATRFAVCTGGIWVTSISFKIVCMRYLDCTFSQMESTNKFSVFFAIWSSQTFPLEIYCGLTIKPHRFHVFVCQCYPKL